VPLCVFVFVCLSVYCIYACMCVHVCAHVRIHAHTQAHVALFCRLLDCGNHVCERTCHDGSCDSCALLPDHVTHCPCGATPLENLLTTSRTSCLDPIPTCDSICRRQLPCSTPGNFNMKRIHEKSGCLKICTVFPQLLPLGYYYLTEMIYLQIMPQCSINQEICYMCIIQRVAFLKM